MATKLKTRLLKRDLNKALLFYNEQLALRHANKLITPAMLHILQTELKKLQESLQRREQNPVWSVPVDVRPAENSYTNIEVYVTDDSNLLFLDA
jgi:hypothetical protein